MKLSLRWVCDHLAIDWKKIDVTTLVAWFNTTVAEIKDVQEIVTDFSLFTIGQIVQIHSETVELFLPETKETIELPARPDIVLEGYYLLKKDGFARIWARPTDFGVEKDTFLPRFSLTKKDAAGAWQKECEASDYIINIDNKSITHRPDLWSHRGFAREIAPFLKTTLRPEKQFLATVQVKESKDTFKATKQIPISISIKTPACKRFAALYFDKLAYTPSALWMGFRLMRVGQRPIDYVVDATNYVMFDIGQPLHAFDAEILATEMFGPRMAHNGEQLSLLSGYNLTLQPTDMVIADHNKALALAGIKGGVASSATQQTRSILLESATFDGGTVRLTSSFHKVRTESSARFEKELDPFQNIAGIMRLIKLLQKEDISFHHAPFVISLGSLPKPTIIKVSQSYIEKRLGIEIKKKIIKKLLEGIGFSVKERKLINDTTFTITVPSYRSTKDVKQPEDIVEEVGRLIGYTTIPEQLPVFEKLPLSSKLRPGMHLEYPLVADWSDRLAHIKNFLAFTARMTEVQTYAFLDNDFVKKMGWIIQHPANLANPIAEQRTTLVDSLILPLLQAVNENSANHEQLGFFEWDRIWTTSMTGNKTHIIERPSLAGVFYQRRGDIDFYRMKDLLKDFFALLALPVSWKNCAHRPQWAHRYQVADIICNGKVIGTAGKVNSVLMAKLGGGDAFGFELDGTTLLAYKPIDTQILPPAKYQGSFLDISMMVPVGMKVELLEQLISHADTRIIHVQLQDVFQKADWLMEKSVTFRFFVQDPFQTVSKELLETISAAVKKSVASIGAVIR